MNSRGDVSIWDFFVILVVYILTLSIVSSVANVSVLNNSSQNVEDNISSRAYVQNPLPEPQNDSEEQENVSIENDSSGGEVNSSEGDSSLQDNSSFVNESMGESLNDSSDNSGQENLTFDNSSNSSVSTEDNFSDGDFNETENESSINNSFIIGENVSSDEDFSGGISEIEDNSSFGENGSLEEEVNSSERVEIIQEKAIVGEGVRWIKRVYTNNPDYIMEVPEGAVRISPSPDSVYRSFKKFDEDGQMYFEVEYETPPAKIVEKNLSENMQEVLISSDYHYQNVTANVSFNGNLSVQDKNRLKIYWKEGKRYLDFNVSDVDEDGYIDYVSWIVPHLSNQTFLIEIQISSAEHLDANRSFVSDISDEVKFLDDVWSENISDGEYVRVRFEKNLTSSNDITIYPKVVLGNPSIKVYEKDSDVLIAEFTKVVSNTYSKVYLSALQGEQDSFDLKVVGGVVIFDHIVDPDLDFEDWEDYQDYNTTFYGNWTNAAGDDCDWQTDSGATASSSTGPSADHTYGNSTGHYVYLETSTSPPSGSSTTCGTTGYEAYLESGDLNASKYNVSLIFWYNMYGAAMGTLHVDVYNGSSWINDVWSLSGDQGDVWTQKTVNFGDYYGTIKIRFRGTRGSDYTSDMAIDDINLTATVRNFPPTAPTSITCNGGTCDFAVDNSVNLSASGSTDPNGDTITYFFGYPFSGSFTTNKSVSADEYKMSVGNVTYFYDGGETWTPDTDCGHNGLWDACSTNSGDGYIQASSDKVGPPTGAENGTYFIMAWDYDTETEFLEKDEDLSNCQEAYVQFATNIGNSLEAGEGLKVYFDDGTNKVKVYDSEAAGEQDETWRNKSFVVSDYVDLTSNFKFILDGKPTYTYDNHEYLAFDDFKIICTEYGAGGNITEENSSEKTYEDLDMYYENLSSLQVRVEVDSYNPEGSDTLSTTYPDLFLYVYNGSDWLPQGEFGLNDYYIFGSEDTIDRNFTIDVTDSSILEAWKNLSNQDIKILATHLDFNDSDTYDEIKYKNIWILTEGSKFKIIGNHTAGGVFVWNTSDVPDKQNIEIRSRAKDLDGSGEFSPLFISQTGLDIDHTNPLIDFSEGTEESGATIFQNSFYSNVSVVELNLENITFRLYNGTSLINETSFSDGTSENTWNNLDSGTYYYNVSVYDQVGRFNKTETRNFTVDIDPPLVSFGSGVENSGESVSQDWIYVNSSVQEDNFKNITFYLYNSSSLVSNVTYVDGTRDLTWTGLEDGTYFYNVTVYDLGNRSNSTTTRNITLDTLAPSGVLNSPPSGTHTRDVTQTFSTDASDSNGLKQAILYIFNATGNLINTNSTLISGLTATVSLVYTFLADGVYTWFYKIFDLADNSYDTENRTLVIDTLPSTISLESVADGSGDSDGYVVFDYNVSDELSNITNCSLVLNGSIVQTNFSLERDVIHSFILDGLGVGHYNWTVECFDEAGNKGQSVLRYFDVIFFSSFDGVSTDLSQVNVSNISDFTVEKTMYGKIKYNEPVNLSGGVDLNSIIKFSSEFVSVDSSSEPRLNKSATITFYNLNYDFLPVIWKGNEICSSCDVDSFGGGNLSFNVSSFSNYSLSENSNLSVWDETDPEGGNEVRFANQQVEFFANYTNISSGETINDSGVYCNITFDDGSYNMVYNSTSGLYEFNRSFSIYGDYDYEVYCNGSSLNYEPLTASDYVRISTPQISNINETGFKVQSGQTTLTSASQLININNVKNISHAFVLPQFYYATGQLDGTPASAAAMRTYSNWSDYIIFLQNETSINVTRFSTEHDLQMSWQVLEATNDEFTVYRGIYDATNAGSSFYVPIGHNVNDSNSMAWITGYKTSYTGASEYDKLLMRASVYNSTHMLVQRYDGGSMDVQISWVVVEWNMSKIDSFQKGNGTVLGGTHTESNHLQISLDDSVDPTSSIMLFQVAPHGNGLDQVSIAGYLSDANTVDFYASSVGTTADSTVSRDVNWYVIDFGDRSGHQERGQIDYSTNTGWYDVDVPLSQQVDTDRTIAFVSETHDGTGTYFPRPFPWVEFSDNETLHLYRTLYGQEAFIEWQVLELPYGHNVDAPIFGNYSVNQSYAANGEVVRVNMTVTDASDNVNYVNGLISGTAYDFNQNGDEWYYDYTCSESGIVNLTWVIARDDGYPERWNSTNITNTYFVCDAEAPQISFNESTLANNSYTSQGSVYVQVDLDEDNFENITYSLYNSTGLVNSTTFNTFVDNITWTGLSTSVYYYNVSVYDKAKQYNQTETRWVHVDVDNPLISYTTGTEENNSVIEGEEIFVNVSVVEDNEANITFYLYDDSMTMIRDNFFNTPQRTITWNNLVDGIYYYKVVVYDLVNRKNETELRKITLDNSAPVINFVAPTSINETNASRSWIFVNVSVQVQNEKNITFSLRNSSGVVNETTYTTPVRTINWTGLGDGDYYYDVIVYDVLDRYDKTETRMIRLDTQAPLLNYESGTDLDGAKENKDWIFVNVSVSDSYFKNVTYSLYNSSGVVNETTYNSLVGEMNWTNLGDGEYTFNVTSCDFSDNCNYTSSRNVLLDTHNPSVVLDSPANNTYSSELVHFLNASFSDNLGLNYSTLFVYNESGDLINETNYSLSGSSDVLNISYNFSEEGNYSWTFEVFDNVDNENIAEKNFIIIDKTNPLISYASGTESSGSQFKRDWVYVNVTASDLNFANLTFRLWGPEDRTTVFDNSTREINWTGLDDGVYRYNVTIVDKAGNENNTETRIIGLDTTPPTVTIYQPEVKTYGYNESLPLNYTAKDNLAGLDTCWWNIDDGTNHTIACDENTTFNTSNGQHTIKVFANDSFGSMSYDSVTFMVSTEGPAVTLVSPTNNSFFSTAGDVVFNYTMEDPDGVDSCALYGDWNGGWHLNQTDSSMLTRGNITFFDDFESGSLSSNWTTYGDSTYSRIGVRTDSAHSGSYSVIADSNTDGNYELSELITTYDFSNAENVVLDFWYIGFSDEANAGADHSGHYNGDAVYFTCDGNYWYDVYDLDGTVTTWTNVNLNLSADPDFCSEINSSFAIKFTQYDNYGVSTDGIGWDDIKVNYTGDVQKTEGNFSVYLSNEGRYNWNVWCNDTLGKGSFSLYNWTFVLDTTTPQISYSGGTLADNSNVTNDWIYVNVSVTESNEKNITFRLYNSSGIVNESVYYTPVREINWTGLDEGVYYYNVTVIDGAGRTNSTETRKVTLDWTAPSVTGRSPQNNTYSNQTTQNLTVNVSDNQGLKEAILYIFNAAGTLINTNSTSLSGLTATVGFLYTFLTDGIYTWFYKIIDIAGNVNETENYTIIIDTVYPQISFGEGVEIDNANVSHNWVYVNVSIDELNLANTTFVLDGPSNQENVFTDDTHEINWTGLADGTYTYNVTVYDKAGQKNYTETRTINIETIAPLVTVVSPVSQTYRTSTIDFNVTLDEEGACNFTLNGGSEVYTMDTEDEIHFNYTNSSMDDGFWMVNFTCVDIYGNVNDTEGVNFDIDTQAPQIQFALGTEANNTYFNRDWIFANVTVQEQNEQNITFMLVGPDSFTNTYTDGRRSINWTYLKEGVYEYNVSVYDTGDNFNSTETRVITLDRTDPIVEFGPSTEGDYANKSRDWIFVQANVTELYPDYVIYTLYDYAGDVVNRTQYYMQDNSSNLTINWTGLEEGDYKYSIEVYDKAGNYDVTSNRSINLDTTAPVVDYSFGTEPDGAEKEQTFIYVSSSIDELHFKNITYRLYNGSGLIRENSSDTFVSNLQWEGLENLNTTYFYNVTVYDWAGNVGITPTRNITLIDVTAPNVTLYSPQNKTYTYNTSILLNFSAADSHLETCWYNLDEGSNVTVANCDYDYFDVSDEQSHTLYLFANDSMGYVTEKNVTFFVNSSLIYTNYFRVQRGSTIVDGSRDVSVDTFDPKKSFIIHTSRSGDAGPDSLQVISKFLNSQQIQFQNYVAGSGAAVEYTVVTGPNISVQRDELDYGTTDGVIGASINSVNLSNSFLVVNNKLNSGTGADNSRGFWTGYFVNDSYVEFSRGSTGTDGVLSYQIVSWDGVTVQNGTTNITAGSGSASATISSVDLSHSFVISSQKLTGDTSIGDYFTRVSFSNSNTLYFERRLSGGNVTSNWFVVSAPFFNVQSQDYTHILTSAQQFDEIPNDLINITHAFDIHSHENDGTGTTYSNGFVTQNIYNSTDMVIQKGTANNNGQTTWFAIEVTDSTPPLVNLTSPANGTSFATSNISSFRFEVFDWQAIANCSLYGTWNGGWHRNQTITNVVNGVNSFSGVDTGSSGDFLWNVLCVDEYGNEGWNSTNYTFNVDMIPPNVSYMNNTTPDGTITNQGWIFINVSAEDPHLDQVILEFNNINESFDNNDGKYYWENKTGLPDGVYTFRVYAIDEGGNTNVTEERTVDMDYNAPTWTDYNQSVNGEYAEIFHQGEIMRLWSSWEDTYGLNSSWLYTNETGTWAKVDGYYSSPQSMTGTVNESSFDWANNSLDLGTKVYWKIYGEDVAGNVNSTLEKSFEVWAHSQVKGILSPQGVLPGENVTMVCNVSNSYTEGGLEGQPVSFYLGNTFLGTNVTGANGSTSWIVTAPNYGTYNVRCNISDNESIYYHASDQNESSRTLGVGYGYYEYDFIDKSNKDAYEGDTALTTNKIDENYSVLEFNDGEFQTYTSSAGNYANVRFEFKIDSSADEITNMSLDWVGYGAVGSGTQGQKIFLYNFTSGSWVEKDSSTLGSEEERSFVQSDGFGDLVNSTGYVYVLVQTSSPASTTAAPEDQWAKISTDYVKLSVRTDIMKPSVTLVSPEDYYNSSSSVDFVCSVTDDYQVENVSLVGDWNGGRNVNSTNSSGLNNTNYTFSVDVEEGVFNWSCLSCDRAGNCEYGENRTLTVDKTAPDISLIFPEDNYNFSDYSVPEFNFSVNDSTEIVECDLFGNWSGGWHLNQTMSNPERNVNNSFSGIVSDGDGFYSWNVNCTDSAGNTGFAVLNYTFATFLPPWEPVLVNITQTRDDGTGNITITWNASNHSLRYDIYTGDNLSNLTFEVNTTDTSYTDVNFAGMKRKFYKVVAVNPVGENWSREVFGAHLYELAHNGVKSRNLIAFPTNFSLKDANETYREINGAVSIAMMNFSTQKRVTCNDFSCPESFACTDTACNFDINPGEGYEVEINTSGPSEVNWSGVGVVYNRMTLNFDYNDPSVLKNKKWIAMYAGTNITNAKELFSSLGVLTDAVTNWNEASQESEGLVPFCPPWLGGACLNGVYIGKNFDIEMEKGYEISVNSSGGWTQE